MNPQRVLGYECPFPTIGNLATKGNCCCGLLPEVLLCLSDCVFPAHGNRHRFSRRAKGTASPSPSIGVSACGVYFTERVMAVHVSCLFSGKSVYEFAPFPPPLMQLSYPHFRKITGSAHLKPSLGKSSSRSWGLTPMFPCYDFREMSKISFSEAQSCNHGSLIQSSPTEGNPPRHPKRAAAWERQEAPQGRVPTAGA